MTVISSRVKISVSAPLSLPTQMEPWPGGGGRGMRGRGGIFLTERESENEAKDTPQLKVILLIAGTDR